MMWREREHETPAAAIGLSKGGCEDAGICETVRGGLWIYTSAMVSAVQVEHIRLTLGVESTWLSTS